MRGFAPRRSRCTGFCSVYSDLFLFSLTLSALLRNLVRLIAAGHPVDCSRRRNPWPLSGPSWSSTCTTERNTRRGKRTSYRPRNPYPKLAESVFPGSFSRIRHFSLVLSGWDFNSAALVWTTHRPGAGKYSQGLMILELLQPTTKGACYSKCNLALYGSSY